MKARIKPNAAEIFLKRERKIFSVLPKTYREFANTLRELENKTLEILSEYDNRIVLKYPKPKNVEGMRVIGIDLEKDLVEILGESKND